jgi:hypothetical protein
MKAPQHEIDRSLNAAAREQLDGVEALARKILLENPYSEPATPFPEQAHEKGEDWKLLHARFCKDPRPLSPNKPTMMK